MSYDIYFYEAFAEEAASLSEHLPEGIRAGYTSDTLQDAGDAAPPAPVISLRTQSILPPDWADSLDALITRSTGYDHLLRYFDRVGKVIPAAHLPLYCNRAVAEQALTLWMALLRKVPAQLQAFESFHRDHLTGGEARGRTLVVFGGSGLIGSQIVDLGRGLGMTVLVVDLDQTRDGVTYVDRDEGLSRADIVVCAMAVNPHTEGYFSTEVWSRCKPGALFVNISRGEISPCIPLLEAMDSGILAGVALDVLNEEPNVAAFLRGQPYEDTPELQAFRQLRERPQVLFTPHNAFNTAEAVERKSAQTVEQYLSWRDTGAFSSPVPTDPA